MLSANNMEQLVTIGTIIAPHGVRGDIRILPQTDHPEQFLELSDLLLEGGRSFKIVSARFHKRMVLVRCQGVESIEDVELLRGKKVLIDRNDLPQLAEDEYYVADLIGLPVLDLAGTQIGILKDVISTGSNDVYVIAVPEGKDILVPALKKHVKEISINNRRIVVELPEWTEAP